MGKTYSIDIMANPLKLVIHANRASDPALLARDAIIETIQMRRDDFNELEIKLQAGNEYRTYLNSPIMIKNRMNDTCLVETGAFIGKKKELFDNSNTFVILGGNASGCLNLAFQKIIDHKVVQSLLSDDRRARPLLFHFNCEGIFDSSPVLSFNKYRSNSERTRDILLNLHGYKGGSKRSLSEQDLDIYSFNNIASMKTFSLNAGKNISRGNLYPAPIFIFYWLKTKDMTRFMKINCPFSMFSLPEENKIPLSWKIGRF